MIRVTRVGFIIGALSLATCAALADSAVDQAIRDYNAGNLDKAISALIRAVKLEGDSGKAHEYLTLAMKKMGRNEESVKQLEAAIKICPEPMLETLARQALTAAGVPVSAAAALPPKPGPFDFLNNIGANIGSMFGGKPAADAGAGMGAASSKGNANIFGFQMPNIFAPVQNMANDVRKEYRKATRQKRHRPPSFSSGNDVISMGVMQDLVYESQDSFLSKWSSQSGGVISYPQAPEFSYEWEQWIGRFKRAFNVLLTRHLAYKAKDELTGKASVIFSLDREGNLRGCIYESTGTERLNKCMLETIRDLNKAKILAFPANSSITGWNFRMVWDYGLILRFIKMVREQQAKIAVKPAVTNLQTDARIKAAATGVKAAIKKLPPGKTATVASLRVVPPQVKTGVSGMVMPRAKPLELKAVPLKLSDMAGKAPVNEPLFRDVLDAMNIVTEEEERVKEEERLKEEERKRLSGETVTTTSIFVPVEPAKAP